ncbi:ABC transporter permease [Frankia sp. QA3]|uniref:ABC transporter permease n=1 Tax=Frankia sp. QA3 TaxID=710111 RepID=UPI000269C82C|nr:ABC transporter permease [Frankia sp. QA3]EIV94575.1 ABC-type nitrate/sulfonate/bicarbonate transport system, permease component [Frankia sp. QA3]
MTELISHHDVARQRAASPGPLAAEPAVAAASGRPPVVLVDPTAGRRRTTRRRRVPPEVRRFLGPALLFALWWALTGLDVVGDRALASPAAVFGAARELWRSGDLVDSLGASLYRVGAGVLFGVGIGLALAIVAGFFRAASDVVDSAMNFLRTIPVIALLPLIIVWIGIGESAKIFLITVGVAFPIYMNTYAAIRGVDARLVEAGQTFGLGRFGLVRSVIVPGAAPGFLVGLRWALGVAWLLLVFAEQVNTDSGLGYLLNSAQSWNRTDIIVLCLVVYGILGLVSDGLVRILERTLLSWRRGFDGT